MNVPTSYDGTTNDIIFSASGSIINASGGRVVLVVSDENNVSPPTLMTVYARTGGVAAHPKGPAGSDAVNTGATATFRVPGAEDPGQPPRQSAPGDEADRTLIMPAMSDPDARAARMPKDAGRIKENVAEWLSRQNEDAEQRSAQPPSRLVPGSDASETMILPNEDLAALGDENDAFGTLAPEDLAALSETASIEMVDGEEVAERLDALFAEPGSDAGQNGGASAGFPDFTDAATEMSLFVPESGAVPGGGEGVPPTETGVPGGMDTEEELPPITGSGRANDKPAPDLAPMLDEEDNYPDEEEMGAEAGAGANVATVTLAEIYFQQGLREQALQIYRQLQEREPENDSVRKRIEEIEAVKPEGGDRGPGSDQRRPRPGLKVPKRKK